MNPSWLPSQAFTRILYGCNRNVMSKALRLHIDNNTLLHSPDLGGGRNHNSPWIVTIGSSMSVQSTDPVPLSSPPLPILPIQLKLVPRPGITRLGTASHAATRARSRPPPLFQAKRDRQRLPVLENLLLHPFLHTYLHIYPSLQACVRTQSKLIVSAKPKSSQPAKQSQPNSDHQI